MNTIELNQYFNGWADVDALRGFTEYAILAVWGCGGDTGFIALDIEAEAPKEWDATVHRPPFFSLYGKEADGEWTALHDEQLAPGMLVKVRELSDFESDHGLLKPGVKAVSRRRSITGYHMMRKCAARAAAGLDGTPLFYQPPKRKALSKTRNRYGWDGLCGSSNLHIG